MACEMTIKFGKVVRILGLPLSDGFELLYGLETNRYELGFASICRLKGGDPTYFKRVYIDVKEDKRKEINIFDAQLEDEDVEDTLLVIIPHAVQLISSAKRLAGRYPTEAILAMHVGDTVELSKNCTGRRTVYMVVQAGNELFLVKKNR